MGEGVPRDLGRILGTGGPKSRALGSAQLVVLLVEDEPVVPLVAPMFGHCWPELGWPELGAVEVPLEPLVPDVPVGAVAPDDAAVSCVECDVVEADAAEGANASARPNAEPNEAPLIAVRRATRRINRACLVDCMSAPLICRVGRPAMVLVGRGPPRAASDRRLGELGGRAGSRA